MKRVIGVLTVLLVLGGLAFAVLNKKDKPTPGPDEVTTLTGMVGSEKGAFFDDQRVKNALKARGLVVNTQSAGSWQMGDLKNDNLDFVFPASQQPAEAIKADHKLTSTPTRPFYSPLVIVTRTQTADVLKANKLASCDEKSNVCKFSMKDFLQGIDDKRTWQQLPKPPAEEKPGDLVGSIFLTTTNPETSSSGALYLAMVSYLLNSGQVIPEPGGVTEQIGAKLRAVITPQGVMKNSTEEPFMDFVSGNGRPLVLAYESQVLELVLKGKAPTDMVMLYPDTTVVSDHTIVAFNNKGQRLADALTDDPALRELELQYGFRPSGTAGATEFSAKIQAAQQNGPKPPFAFAPDLGAAKISQATVPTPEVMKSLVGATKSK
ncbi:substrate-binding domain-containing protein [Kitasatospora sp. NPDC094019]|uniref:substrate-binding domain-containing protein n=1 Tax=Kitasatospora sp. NPDC094019 TaxID=3364091 RepID=UPI0038156EBD